MPQFKYSSFDEMHAHRDETYRALKDIFAEADALYAGYLRYIELKKEAKILDKTMLKIAYGRVLIHKKKK